MRYFFDDHLEKSRHWKFS